MCAPTRVERTDTSFPLHDFSSHGSLSKLTKEVNPRLPRKLESQPPRLHVPVLFLNWVYVCPVSSIFDHTVLPFPVGASEVSVGSKGQWF